MEFFFKIGTFVAVVVVIIYAFFISSTLRSGPIINITSPTETETSLISPVLVSGTIENAVYASINDKEINPNLSGVFQEVVPLPYGYAIIEIYARDSRGNETHIYRHLNIKDPNE